MSDTTKTVIEWLQEAKEQGYEWAEFAIERHKKENSPIAQLQKFEKLSSALWSAFNFERDQPFDFWQIAVNLEIHGL